MKKIKTSLLTLGATLIAAASMMAASAYMDPVGAMKLACPQSTDTYVTVPFTVSPAYVGTVGSVASNVVTVGGTSPAWTADQFANNSYCIFKSGAKAGYWYTITANGANTVTLDLMGDSIDTVVAGDGVSVVAYQTLIGVYPAADVGTSFQNSTNTLSRKTELYFKNPNYIGINTPSPDTYYFYNSAWRKVGQNATISFNTTQVPPDTWFIQRNKEVATAVVTNGNVQMVKEWSVITRNTSSKDDNEVALPRPIGMTLDSSGLYSGGVFEMSTNTLSRKDELMIISNTTTGINKSFSATYFYYNSAWRKVGSAATLNFGTDNVFDPLNYAVVIRKTTGAAGTSLNWINDANY